MARYKPTRKWKHDSHCYYCAEEFGLFQDRYIIQESVKMPKTPYRWKQIGSMCEGCNIKGRPSHYDKFQFTHGDLYNDKSNTPKAG